MFKKSYKIKAPEPQSYFPTGKELKMATAIYDGDLHSIQSMIDNGFDLNRIGKGGMTYLYYAMLTMNYDTMELLLKNGANPNIHSKFFTDPDLHKKGQNDEQNTGVCLEYSGYPAYDIKYMKLLIKYGANVNDTTYISPLSSAIRDKNQGKEKIKYLVEHGINLNFSITNTSVACSQATIYNWDMVLFLLDIGADPMASEDPDFNVASAVQDYYDEGFDLDSENGKLAQEVKRRLEQRGIKFPYHPKSHITSSESKQ
ncbi:ankyrin repeat domain-containing protein [Prevotella denticola]|uniref:ankyrin repeat domain-containing protein n=1 Tax=Prevotella denticola TaxID=28129 RepID=UPI0028E527A9|nr:ankyrin repeat domain-containing protein [Prevotella denticola]